MSVPFPRIHPHNKLVLCLGNPQNISQNPGNQRHANRTRVSPGRAPTLMINGRPYIGASPFVRGHHVVCRPNKGRRLFVPTRDVYALVRPVFVVHCACEPSQQGTFVSSRPNKGRSFPVRPNVGATVDQVGVPYLSHGCVVGMPPVSRVL